MSCTVGVLTSMLYVVYSWSVNEYVVCCMSCTVGVLTSMLYIVYSWSVVVRWIIETGTPTVTSAALCRCHQNFTAPSRCLAVPSEVTCTVDFV